jgi:hypothetical protein
MIGSEPFAATQAMAVSAGVTSRALAKTDPALADEVLEAVRKIVSAAYKIERARIE